MAGRNSGHFVEVVIARSESDEAIHSFLAWRDGLLRSARNDVVRAALQSQLLLALAERAQPQGVELDEAGGVAVIVGDRAFLEGDEVLIVQRVLALASNHDDVALVAT